MKISINFEQKTMMKTIFILLLFLPIFSFFGQTTLTLEDIWQKPKYRGQGVNGFVSMNDGLHFSKMNYSEDGKSFKDISKYSFENAEKAVGILLEAKNLENGSNPIAMDGYSFNADESNMLISQNTQSIYRRSYTAEHYIFDLKTKSLSELDSKNTPQKLVEFSPDGSKIAYVVGNNLFIKTLSNGKIQQLTKELANGNISCGHTDWVYEEEFAFTKAFEWSKDGTQLAYLRFDSRKIPNYTLISHVNELYPELYTYPYPKAGENNSIVTLHIAKVGSNKKKLINLGSYEYIPRMKWSPIENKLLVLTLNRWQNDLNYHLVDPSKGLSSTVIYTEKDKAYVDIDDNLLILKDGKHFLRTSEKDGFNHIYKIGFDGSSIQITKGNWDVKSLKGINETSGTLYYTSAEEGAIYTGLYKIALDGSNKIKLSEKIGSTDAEFSNGMNYFLQTFSNTSTPPQYSLRRADGSLVNMLEDNSDLAKKVVLLNLPKVEFSKIEGAGGTLNLMMMKPVNFDPNKKYPIYFNVYCGPGSNEVLDTWEGFDYFYHSLLTQKGYIVVKVDTRGTQYQGAEFKKCTYLQLGKYEIEDLIAVAQNLGKLPYVDASRIGIMGWSYGGYMSSLAITKGSEQFKMAIAVAPVTNWKWYDNIYTERFMRTPKENQAGYDDNSPINHTKKIKGKYLIIHGTGDDNVHDQHSFEMINALVKNNIQFESFFYPNRNHGIGGGNTRYHLYNMMLNFTLKNL